LIRRHYGKPLELSAEDRKRRLWVRLTCLLFVIFFAAFALFFVQSFKDIGLLSPKGNPWLRLIQLVGWLAVLGTFVTIYSAIRSWRSQQWWATRLGNVVIALACVGAVWFIFTWNMLHWSLKY
jgi:hypothetical protein